MINERLYAKKEIAVLLGVSTRSIDRWIAAGTFPEPCFRVWNTRRWSREQIHAHQSEQEIKAQHSKPASVITIGQIASRLTVTKTVLERWVQDGLFPAPTVINSQGHQWSIEVIEQWESEHIRVRESE